MSIRNRRISFSVRTLTMGLLLASSSAFAQEVAPTPTAAPAAPPPVEAAVQPVTPPPAVRTLPNESDRIAPKAAADAAAERAERAPVREAAPARRAPPAAVPEPSAPTKTAAPDAPVVAGSVVDTAPVAPVEEPVAEVVQNDVVPVDMVAGDNEWLIGAGIAGALGLAGIALFASRRRRRRSGDVVSETGPVSPVPYAEPHRDVARPTERPIVRPAAAPAFAATAANPLFSRPRHDIPVGAPMTRDAGNLPGVTDPLFSYRAEQAPVTDPMFARKIEVPAITDPMFAQHPEYEGAGADRTRRSGDIGGSSFDRVRELVPAE